MRKVWTLITKIVYRFKKCVRFTKNIFNKGSINSTELIIDSEPIQLHPQSRLKNHALPNVLHKILDDEYLTEEEKQIHETWKKGVDGSCPIFGKNDVILDQVIDLLKSTCEPFKWTEYMEIMQSGDQEKVKQMTLEIISYKIMIGKQLTKNDMNNLREYYPNQEDIDDFIQRNKL